MAVQEMHTIQKVEGGSGWKCRRSKRSCTKKKNKKKIKSREEMGRRAMCRVQPLYIKNWKKNGEKSYNT